MLESYEDSWKSFLPCSTKKLTFHWLKVLREESVSQKTCMPWNTTKTWTFSDDKSIALAKRFTHFGIRVVKGIVFLFGRVIWEMLENCAWKLRSSRGWKRISSNEKVPASFSPAFCFGASSAGSHCTPLSEIACQQAPAEDGENSTSAKLKNLESEEIRAGACRQALSETINIHRVSYAGPHYSNQLERQAGQRILVQSRSH